MKDIVVFMLWLAIFIVGFGVVGHDEFQPLQNITGQEYATSVMGALVLTWIFN